MDDENFETKIMKIVLSTYRIFLYVQDNERLSNNQIVTILSNRKLCIFDHISINIKAIICVCVCVCDEMKILVRVLVRIFVPKLSPSPKKLKTCGSTNCWLLKSNQQNLN